MVRNLKNDDLPRRIIIVYHRLPDTVREYPGLLRGETPGMLTIESRLTTSKRTSAFGKIIADNGYLAIWFIFRNRWYDVGKFYDLSGKWLGYYCDIILPVPKLLADQSRTVELTNLYLDLWIFAEYEFLILDENEFADAIEKRYLTEKIATQAKDQLNILLEMIRRQEFPPKEVREIEPMKKSI